MPPAAAAHLTTAADPDEDICSSPAAAAASEEEVAPPAPLLPPPASAEERVERAWAHWRRLGAPRLVVAPMVDNSELPFRMLCRRYGATAAYTPMLHSRIFSENEKHRDMEFTTCKVRDRADLWVLRLFASLRFNYRIPQFTHCDSNLARCACDLDDAFEL
jgi:tRNA-dihydrouridine synthase 1